MIFEILQDKSLVTTGMIDGARKDLNLNKAKIKEIEMEKFAEQDGTIIRESKESDNDSPTTKQTRLEAFFNKNKDSNFVKRPPKVKIIEPIIAEEIESESDDQIDRSRSNITYSSVESKRETDPPKSLSEHKN